MVNTVSCSQDYKIPMLVRSSVCNRALNHLRATFFCTNNGEGPLRTRSLYETFPSEKASELKKHRDMLTSFATWAEVNKVREPCFFPRHWYSSLMRVSPMSDELGVNLESSWYKGLNSSSDVVMCRVRALWGRHRTPRPKAPSAVYIPTSIPGMSMTVQSLLGKW